MFTAIKVWASGLLARLREFWPVRFYLNILGAVDHLGNAVLLGDYRETISSRMGKHVRDGTCRPCTIICGILSTIWLDPKHCQNAIDSSVGYATGNNGSTIRTAKEKGAAATIAILGLLAFWQWDIVWDWIGVLM